MHHFCVTIGLTKLSGTALTLFDWHPFYCQLISISLEYRILYPSLHVIIGAIDVVDGRLKASEGMSEVIGPTERRL